MASVTKNENTLKKIDDKVYDTETNQAHDALDKLDSPDEISEGAFIPAGKNDAKKSKITESTDGALQDSDNEGTLSALQSLERRRKKKRRKIIIRVAIVAALVVLALAIKVIVSMLTPAEDCDLMRYESVVQETWQQSVSATGSAQPDSVYVVTPEVTGIIDTVDVQEGQKVKKGDRLLTIHSADTAKAVEEAQRAVNSASAAVDEAYSKAMEAYSNESAGVEGYEGATAAAQAELDTASATLESAKATLQEAQAVAAKQTITAPADGTVTVMNAVKGAGFGTTNGGSVQNATTLIQIADLSKMRVRVQVKEDEVSAIKKGQEAEVTFNALPDLSLVGKVEKIATVAAGTEGGEEGFGGGSSMYSVEIVIEKPDERIKPGMTASVEIVTEVIEDALQVPMMAVMTASPEMADAVAEGYDGFVEVVDEGQDIVDIDPRNPPSTHPVDIKIIKEANGIYIIEGNLQAGDFVVLLGSTSDASNNIDDFSYDEGSNVETSVAVA